MILIPLNCISHVFTGLYMVILWSHVSRVPPIVNFFFFLKKNKKHETRTCHSFLTKCLTMYDLLNRECILQRKNIKHDWKEASTPDIFSERQHKNPSIHNHTHSSTCKDGEDSGRVTNKSHNGKAARILHCCHKAQQSAFPWSQWSVQTPLVGRATAWSPSFILKLVWLLKFSSDCAFKSPKVLREDSSRPLVRVAEPFLSARLAGQQLDVGRDSAVHIRAHNAYSLWRGCYASHSICLVWTGF